MDARDRRRARHAARGQAGRGQRARGCGRSTSPRALPSSSAAASRLADLARSRAGVVRRAFRTARRRRALRRRRRPGGDDASVRPNQLLAVSLPEAPLAGGADAGRAAVDVCRRSLLTPLGLRSLAPDDPRYRPYHRGSPAERDCGLPPGHRLALADRALRRRRARGRRPGRRRPRRPRGAPRRLGRSARSPRPPTAPRRTPPPAARSRPGRWPRSCAFAAALAKRSTPKKKRRTARARA